MKTSIRELRESMKRILGAVQHGKEVTIYSRKKPIAKIVPIKLKELRHTDAEHGFGMWSNHEDTNDVSAYLQKLRKGRQHDF